MTAEALTITELTGSRRVVELQDRALPYRPVPFGGEAKHVKRVYPGNPVATIQMLGPSMKDTPLNGVWKTRYIADMALIAGFDDLAGPGDAITAEILAKVFHRLMDGGNLLEVSWGPEVRRGVLAEFTPTYLRVEDIEWSCNFVWAQRGQRVAPRIAQAPTKESQLRKGMAELDASLAQRPPYILPNITAPLFVVEEAIRLANSTMISSMNLIYGTPQVTLAQYRGISSEAETIAANVAELRQLLSDSSIEDLIATDDVGYVLGAETWVGDVTSDAIDLAVAAVEARESIRARVIEPFIGTDKVGQWETLRNVAMRWYGDADSWQLIADANGLTGSVQPVGTFVFIPRRANAGTGGDA